jgi:hypothetical protein
MADKPSTDTAVGHADRLALRRAQAANRTATWRDRQHATGVGPVQVQVPFAARDLVLRISAALRTGDVSAITATAGELKVWRSR